MFCFSFRKQGILVPLILDKKTLLIFDIFIMLAIWCLMLCFSKTSLKSNIYCKGHDFRRFMKWSDRHKTVGNKVSYKSMNNKVNCFISTMVQHSWSEKNHNAWLALCGSVLWNNKRAEIISLQKLLIWLGKQKEKASCQRKD